MEWLVQVVVGNENCPFRAYMLRGKYECLELVTGVDCTYETCPHRLPASEEEYNA